MLDYDPADEARPIIIDWMSLPGTTISSRRLLTTAADPSTPATRPSTNETTTKCCFRECCAVWMLCWPVGSVRWRRQGLVAWDLPRWSAQL